MFRFFQYPNILFKFEFYLAREHRWFLYAFYIEKNLDVPKNDSLDRYWNSPISSKISAMISKLKI